MAFLLRLLTFLKLSAGKKKTNSDQEICNLKSYKYLKIVMRNLAKQLWSLLALCNLLLFFLLSLKHLFFLTLFWYKCTYYIKIRVSILG